MAVGDQWAAGFFAKLGSMSVIAIYQQLSAYNALKAMALLSSVRVRFWLLLSLLVCVPLASAGDAPKVQVRFSNDYAKPVEFYVDGKFECSVRGNPEGNNEYCDRDSLQGGAHRCRQRRRSRSTVLQGLLHQETGRRLHQSHQSGTPQVYVHDTAALKCCSPPPFPRMIVANRRYHSLTLKMGVLSEIAIYRHLFAAKNLNHQSSRGRHSTPFAETASMSSRDSSSPASSHSKITYRRPQFRQLVQGAQLGSSSHGINALRSNSDIASALVWNLPSCSSQWASSSITNIQTIMRQTSRKEKVNCG